MRFVTFEHNGHQHAGALSNNSVISLKAAGFENMGAVLKGGTAALAQISGFLAHPPAASTFRESDVRLRAPFMPGKIICVGLNYRDHAIESKMEVPSRPTIFSKYLNTVIGPGDEIILPKNTAKPDYEAELAFVIGRRGRHIKAAEWKDYLFGYTNVNDVSARDVQLAVSQWVMGKSFDTFCPIGPWLVTVDEIADPHDLSISLTVNGETRQNSNTKELIFRIPELVEFLSSIMTLEPGDIVSTGTPSGVGSSYTPPRWLRPGDEVVVKVEGLGELRNRCVAET